MNKYFYTCFFIALTLTSKAQDSPLRLSLDKAIEVALKNSYNTRAAENDMAAAKEKVWETTTIGLPQINGVVDYQRFLKQPITVADIDGDGVNEEFVFGTEQNINGSVTLSQLLFDGTYLVGLQSAKTFLKISEQAKEKTALLTREAVINAYGNVLISENSVVILESNLKILEKNYNDAKKIYENGLSEEEDVEQLLITLGDVKNQLNSVKRLTEIAYQMLNLALGNKIDTAIVLTDSLDSLTENHIKIEILGKQFLFEDHIDYRIAANDRETKRLMVKLEKSKSLPSLNAFINYGTQAFSNEFSFFNSSQSWFQSSLLGISLKVPIFSSFARRSRTAQAKIELNTADLRLEETKQRIELQAKKAKSDYQLSVESYQTAKRNLGLAERIEKKQRIKFFEGLSTSFNLLQAQTQLYAQQQNYIQSMLSVITKKAALENALNLPIK
ncbi:MAG: TolC family protein [Polaribacter sp.]|jgi:outer membrane protein